MNVKPKAFVIRCLAVAVLILLSGWLLTKSWAEPVTSSEAGGRRKVIVGTFIFSVFETQRPYESLEKRLEEIGQRLGEMGAEVLAGYGRGLDVAVFPELSLNHDATLPIATMLKEIGVLCEPELRGSARKKRDAALAASNATE